MAERKPGYWWASVEGGAPQVVHYAVGVSGDEWITVTGNDVCLEDHEVRFIEPVLPAGHAAAAEAPLRKFEEAYWTASETSDPQRWMEAALLGKQFANAIRKALT